MLKNPQLVILAGPNGAGKSTAAPPLLKGVLRVTQFVNADTIARGLAGFDPEDAALLAARIMLERVRELIDRRVSMAVETTLASRALASIIRAEAIPVGFRVYLVFLWVDTPELAIARVHARVADGGHDVPEDKIQRRYVAGIRNFFELYRPLAAQWRVYNNSSPVGPVLIASGGQRRSECVYLTPDWVRVQQQGKR